MSSTPYEKIYASFLSKLRSYDFLGMDEEELRLYLQDYLSIAIPNFHVCRQDLSDRDDKAEQFNIELTPMEIEILSNYMLLAYIDSTYIRTPALLKATLNSTDFNAFSPANQLSRMTEMQERFRGENEALVSRYAWIVSDNSSALNGIQNGYKK